MNPLEMLFNILKYSTSNRIYETEYKPYINLDNDFIQDCLDAYYRDKEKQSMGSDGEWKDLAQVGYTQRMLFYLGDKDLFKEKIREMFHSFYLLSNTKKQSLYEYMVLMNRINKSYGFVDWLEGQSIVSTDGNARYIYDAHNINLLLKGVKSPVVLEIGGGFGGLGYHLMKQNPFVCYSDVDLPEMLLISRVCLKSNFDDKDIGFIPNDKMDSIPSGSVDVVVNCHSLSEMNKETVDYYCKHISRICKSDGYFYSVNSRVPISVSNHVEVPYTEFKLDGFRLLHESRSYFSDLVDRRHFECLYQKKGE